MKWFKHSVHARSEHGTEDILRCHGPAGIGIYWCLLEMLARDTEQFRLRISGVSAEADERFDEARSLAGTDRPGEHLYRVDILAKTLNTEAETILAVISLGVSEGLFDRHLWQTYSILHSPGFSRQADEYTRRLRRSSQHSGAHTDDSPPETLRQTTESLRTFSSKVPAEEMRTDQKRKKTEPHAAVDNSAPSGSGAPPSGVFENHNSGNDADALLVRCSMLVADWNRRNRRTFELRLSRSRLRRLLGGDPLWRERVCYESMNLTHGGATFDDVILRAVWLMLEASRQKPIGNQFAWLWSCVHGRGDSPPWVHRPIPSEELGPRTRPAQSEQEFRRIGEILALRTSADGGSRR